MYKDTLQFHLTPNKAYKSREPKKNNSAPHNELHVTCHPIPRRKEISLKDRRHTSKTELKPYMQRIKQENNTPTRKHKKQYIAILKNKSNLNSHKFQTIQIASDHALSCFRFLVQPRIATQTVVSNISKQS